MAKQAPAPAAAANAAANSAKSADIPQEEQPKKKRSKKKILLVALLALLFTGGGAGGYFAMQPAAEGEAADDAEAAEAASDEERKPPVFLNMENFVVNLRDEEAEHYLQLGLVLEASSQEAIDEMKIQMPRIRNGILLLLSSKSSIDLNTMEGKRKLMEEIVTAAREPMPLPAPSKGIESVYFSAFVIQ